MEKCKYATLMECEECTYISYKKCDKFRKAHISHLCRELIPFKYKYDEKFEGKLVVRSGSIDTAKSFIAYHAIKQNERVAKVNINQLLHVAMSDNPIIDAQMIYIDCAQIPFGDKAKLLSVVKSFIEHHTYYNIHLALFAGQYLPQFPEYPQI